MSQSPIDLQIHLSAWPYGNSNTFIVINKRRKNFGKKSGESAVKSVNHACQARSHLRFAKQNSSLLGPGSDKTVMYKIWGSKWETIDLPKWSKLHHASFHSSRRLCFCLICSCSRTRGGFIYSRVRGNLRESFRRRVYQGHHSRLRRGLRCRWWSGPQLCPIVQ